MLFHFRVSHSAQQWEQLREITDHAKQDRQPHLSPDCHTRVSRWCEKACGLFFHRAQSESTIQNITPHIKPAPFNDLRKGNLNVSVFRLWLIPKVVRLHAQNPHTDAEFD